MINWWIALLTAGGGGVFGVVVNFTSARRREAGEVMQRVRMISRRVSLREPDAKLINQAMDEVTKHALAAGMDYGLILNHELMLEALLSVKADPSATSAEVRAVEQGVFWTSAEISSVANQRFLGPVVRVLQVPKTWKRMKRAVDARRTSEERRGINQSSIGPGSADVSLRTLP